jgi:hypothetical protein
MNDNEGTIPQQIAHRENIAETIREDLKEARADVLMKPGDEKLTKQIDALEVLLKGSLAKIERLRRQGRE